MRRLIVIQHVEREGPGLFLNIAKEYYFEIIICRIYLFKNQNARWAMSQRLNKGRPSEGG